MREKILSSIKNCKINLSLKELTKLVLQTEKSYLTKTGAVATFTGKRSSRSPKDKYIVLDQFTEKKVDWSSKYNQPISQQVFDAIFKVAFNYLKDRQVYVVDCSACQDEIDRFDMTVFTDTPSQAMFAKIMFRDAVQEKITDFSSQYTIISVPELNLNFKKFGINSEAFIGIDFTRKIVLVVGTGYVCEIKKAMFTIYNYEKPQKGILTMHSSANSDKNGKNSAIFFGLSGTGKTTLSTLPGRYIVSDDENCWNDRGLFNIEDGCYAKIYEIDKARDPEIFEAIKDGALIENAPQDSKGNPNFFDNSITENIRAAYPLENLSRVIPNGQAEAPKNIFFLTADSTGVFPPISLLNSKQIMYYFLNGFTSKMTGLEGDTKEPEWTFSPCFGAPFMPLKVSLYAKLLEKKVAENNCKVWLVNTGWTGGRYGVGTRIKLKDTKRMVDEAIKTGFNGVKFVTEPYFGLSVPTHCEKLSNDDILLPYKTWSNLGEYEEMVAKVKQAFKKNCKENKIKEI